MVISEPKDYTSLALPLTLRPVPLRTDLLLDPSCQHPHPAVQTRSEGLILEPSYSGMNSGPERYVYLEPVNVMLFGKRAFVHVMKLRILRCNHPGLSCWALRKMTQKRDTDTEEKLHEDRQRLE